MKKHTSVVTTGSPEKPGLPCAMVLTASFVLSPAIGLSCHRRKRNAQALSPLDASVEASGPHDFAVRKSAVRPRKDCARRLSVHRIPSPTFVTIASRPSFGDETPLIYRCFYLFAKRNIFRNGAGHEFFDLPVGQAHASSKAKYFWVGSWTAITRAD
jgi:hypothetical protein